MVTAANGPDAPAALELRVAALTDEPRAIPVPIVVYPGAMSKHAEASLALAPWAVAPVSALVKPVGQAVLVAVVTAFVETNAAPIATVPLEKPWKAVVAASVMAAAFGESAAVVPTGQNEPAGHGMGIEHEPEAPVVPAVALVQAAAVPVATGR